jgi:hypothetical protein
MISNRAKLNKIAVSAYQRETGINVFRDLDLTLLTALSDIISLEPRRESNKDEATGKEEPDEIYDLGKTGAMSMNFEKAQPQHYAFLFAFGFGTVVSSAAGSGFLKTITPTLKDLDAARDLPSFTAGQAYSEIVRKRLASFFVNGITATFAKDAFCKVAGEIVGTGKYEKSITEETVSAAEDVTSLTLDTNGVAGSTAAERLDAIHQIRVELATGVWTEVAFSAVSAATPAVITITAPGEGTDVRNFKILYAPTAAAWMTFPARVTETPLRVSELTFNLGGAWNGTAFVGGRDLGPEIKSIEYRLANNGKVEFAPGAGGAYASRYVREDRDQTLGLDLEFRNYILQNLMDTNEYFGARILAEGLEFDTGHKYSVEMIFPKLGILKAPLTVDGRRLGEKGDLQVLQHDTYGSAIVRVKNLAQYYAA